MDERRGLRAGYLAVAIGFVSIIMAFALAATAVRYQVIAPPWLHVQLGDLHLVAHTTPVPVDTVAARCPSYPAPCSSGYIYDQYSVWLVDTRQLPAHPDAAFWRVLAVALN